MTQQTAPTSVYIHISKDNYVLQSQYMFNPREGWHVRSRACLYLSHELYLLCVYTADESAVVMCGGDGLRKTEIIRSTAPHDRFRNPSHVCTPIDLLYCINGLVRTAGELNAGSSEGKDEHIFFALADFLSKVLGWPRIQAQRGWAQIFWEAFCSSLE